MQCFYHLERGAVGFCRNCGKAACRECIEEIRGVLLCLGCQEIARSAQHAEEQEERAVRDRIASRAALKLRIARYVFWGSVAFGVVLGIASVIGTMNGSLQDPRLDSPSGVLSFLGALPFGILIAAYLMWGFYWGEIAAWRFWMKFVRKAGCFSHVPLIGWLTFMALFVTCPYMLGAFYGIFGGGIVEYRRTKQLAGNDAPRRIVQHPWRVAALALLFVGSIVAASRLMNLQQGTQGRRDVPGRASQPVTTPSVPVNPPVANRQSAPESDNPIPMSLITDSGVLDLQSALTSDSLLSPITDPEVAAHLARHIRKASTDTDPIIVVSLDGGEAWVNLEGRIVSLLLERVEGDPESTYTGDKFTRTFTRDGISLLVQYEVLSSFVIHDMGCTRTEYKLSIDLFSGSTEEHISPESYGEGC